MQGLQLEGLFKTLNYIGDFEGLSSSGEMLITILRYLSYFGSFPAQEEKIRAATPGVTDLGLSCSSRSISHILL
jgi:hypothetical protein